MGMWFRVCYATDGLFCMIKFFSMLDFDVELTMSGQYRRCEWKSDWYLVVKVF